MPRSFGGEKNNFSDDLIANGYEVNTPQTYNGDNLNYQLNATGKEFEYVESVVDYIVAMPSNNILTVNSNNQLDYLNANTLAVDNNVVHKTGDETIAGTKTFNNTIVGSVNGNANTATNDIDGNPIKTTYQKVSNLSQVINESETNYPSNKAVKTAIDAKDSLPSQTGNAGKFLTTDGTNASWDYLTSLPVGTIFPCVCSANWTPENALPVDGAEYASSQFPSLWSDFLTSTTPRLATCSYTEYASEIATYGQCAKFAVDTTNNKFKVPTIKDGSYITQALSGSEIAKAYNESLPNIKGDFGSSDWMLAPNMSGSGAFYVSSGGKYTTNDQKTSNGGYNVAFNASDSSSVYADNANVQEKGIQVYTYFYVGEWTKDATENTAGLNAELFNGKLDISTYNNNPRTNGVYLKTTYLNGASGYNIWSNGYCEQWGITTTNGTTVTFLKAFRDTNYAINMTCTQVTSNYEPPSCIDLTTTSFKATRMQVANNSGEARWYACGYLAEGKY